MAKRRKGTKRDSAIAIPALAGYRPGQSAPRPNTTSVAFDGSISRTFIEFHMNSFDLECVLYPQRNGFPMFDGYIPDYF